MLDTPGLHAAEVAGGRRFEFGANWTTRGVVLDTGATGDRACWPRPGLQPARVRARSMMRIPVARCTPEAG